MDKAVVLLSGGMDSTVTLALAKEAKYDVATLFLDYGQRTLEGELRAFNAINEFYSISERIVIDCSHFKQIGKSSLTNLDIEVEIPNDLKLNNEKINSNQEDINTFRAPNTYVPFRNANILAMATSWAETIDARALFIGAVEEDSSGYPDTRPEFFEAFEKAIAWGTAVRPPIKIITPIIKNTKDEIVLKGLRLGAPLYLTQSCYVSSKKACGKCESCLYRLRGFEKAGVKDPIEYQE
ncbi:MAG: 7-cyano-7-deazaguanine synthase QueC [Candidatus Kapaibacteriales bacterium]